MMTLAGRITLAKNQHPGVGLPLNLFDAMRVVLRKPLS
jgi:hypothetical protein